jgi:ATP-binding cassette subfamily B protein
MAGTQKTASSMSRVCLWALGYGLRRRAALLTVLATMILKIALDVLKPWPMLFVVDHVLRREPLTAGAAWAVELLPGPSTPAAWLTWCVSATIVLFLLVWALGLAAAVASINFGQRLVYDLAADVFGHLQRLSLRFHSRNPVGDTIRRVTADCSCVAAIVKDALLPVLTAALSLVVMFGIMWHLDAMLTLLALAVVPAMIMVFRRYAEPMLERSYDQHQVEGQVYDVVEQTLSAIPVVQAYGREEQVNQRFRDACRDAVRSTLDLTSVQMKFKILMGLSTTAGTGAILWVGANHVLDGRLTIGAILVFLSYLASLYAPLEALMYSTSTIQGAAGNARRVLEILQIEREVADRPGARPLPHVRGHVRLENVTFGYAPDRAVLQGVSLVVLPGQVIAVVGATGAGKTTLVSLVLRFFDPWEGRVTIDGHDLRDVQVKSLRDQVALVLQEPFLFPLTIAENIAYGRPGAPREEIEAAARAANIHDFIEQLPNGYDTPVGERGATLSGGERQRLSIARAFLKNAPVLILDEPTSALDAATEGLLLEALERLMKARTTLIIAHRFSTIRNADRIVVLHEGRVVENGTHQELLALAGHYAHFHALQFGQPLETATGGQS